MPVPREQVERRLQQMQAALGLGIVILGQRQTILVAPITIGYTEHQPATHNGAIRPKRAVTAMVAGFGLSQQTARARVEAYRLIQMQIDGWDLQVEARRIVTIPTILFVW